MGNASFTVDFDVVNCEDLKSDDLGSWKSTGTTQSFFRFSQSGELRICATRRSEYYLLTRRNYINESYEKFHRHIVDIEAKCEYWKCML